MSKKHILLGLIIGLFTAIVGMFLFLEFFTTYSFVEGWKIMKYQRQTGKLIAIGAVPNLFVFFALLKFDQEMTARGVVLATIIITTLSVIL
jgi:hypothetical protein